MAVTVSTELVYNAKLIMTLDGGVEHFTQYAEDEMKSIGQLAAGWKLLQNKSNKHAMRGQYMTRLIFQMMVMPVSRMINQCSNGMERL